MIYKSKGQVNEHLVKRASDQSTNVQLAKKHADMGYTVDVLPYDYTNGALNPDCRINGLIADFKEASGSQRSIQGRIADASRQKAIPLITIKVYNKRSVIRATAGQFGVGFTKDNVQAVWLLLPNSNDYIKLSTSSILDRSFIGLLP